MELTRLPEAQTRIDRLPVPFASVTAYDYPTARLADEAGIDVILVGDSLGMMFGGEPDTTGVTLEQMVYHTQVVSRAVNRALLIADLPIHSYDSPEQALHSAKQLIEAGADAVKLEGGLGQVDKIQTLMVHDIPVIGHLGMLPQRVREEGGYRKKGKTSEESKSLLEAAEALAEAGVLMIVLESVAAGTAEEITSSLTIPTLGIGSGVNCSGQIRVIHDVIGAFPWFVPPFAKTYVNVADLITEGLQQYREELK